MHLFLSESVLVLHVYFVSEYTRMPYYLEFLLWLLSQWLRRYVDRSPIFCILVFVTFADEDSAKVYSLSDEPGLCALCCCFANIFDSLDSLSLSFSRLFEILFTSANFSEMVKFATCSTGFALSWTNPFVTPFEIIAAISTFWLDYIIKTDKLNNH